MNNHPKYTDAMGRAGEAYLSSFKHAHPLPVQFRWCDLWSVMVSAAPVASDEPDGDRIINLLTDHAIRAAREVDKAAFAKALSEVRRLREKNAALQSKNARLERATTSAEPLATPCATR